MITINKDYVLKHVLDSDVLVNINSKTKSLIKLSKVSKEIFDYISSGKDTTEIIDLLFHKYDIDIDTVTNDVNEFVDNMINIGIFIKK